MILLFNV